MSKRVSKISIDHDEIRRWAEARGAQPAVVRGTGRRGTGIIRLDFPGYTGEEKLEHISWDEWFGKFDESNLALVFEETTARGQKSNFNKLIGRETVDTRTGELVGPPRRRAEQGARTPQEARKLRGKPVSAAKSPRAAPRAGAGARTAEKATPSKAAARPAARGASARAGTKAARSGEGAKEASSGARAARGASSTSASGGGGRRRATRA